MQCSCQTNILSPMKLVKMRCACFLVDQVHHGGGEKAEAALVDQLHENPLGRVQRPGQGGGGVGAPAQGGGPPRRGGDHQVRRRGDQLHGGDGAVKE